MPSLVSSPASTTARKTDSGRADQPASASRGPECRVYERHSCSVPSQCKAAAALDRDELKWAATLENISKSGVCLNLRRRFEPGAGLAVELPGKAANDTYTVLAKVVHVRRQANGDWSLGCRFISELSEDEMTRLLPAPPLAAPALSGKRFQKPKERHEVSQLRLQLEINSRTTVGCVIQQFAAAAFWPLAAGTIGVLKGSDRDGFPWKLCVRVLDCHFEDDNWNLNCKLLKAPAKMNLLRALDGLVVKN